MRRLVTPLMADTTTTQGFSLAALAMICALRAIHVASPTDVPPNFITCSAEFIPASLTCLTVFYSGSRSGCGGWLSSLIQHFIEVYENRVSAQPKARVRLRQSATGCYPACYGGPCCFAPGNCANPASGPLPAPVGGAAGSE